MVLLMKASSGIALLKFLFEMIGEVDFLLSKPRVSYVAVPVLKAAIFS